MFHVNVQLLGCESVAILPEGMSKERFDWLRTVAGEIIATPDTKNKPVHAAQDAFEHAPLAQSLCGRLCRPQKFRPQAAAGAARKGAGLQAPRLCVWVFASILAVPP